VSFSFLRPFLGYGFLWFSSFIAAFRSFLPGEIPFFFFPGNPPKRRKVPGIAPLKRIQNVPFRPFSIFQENKPSILPSTAFFVPGWYKTPYKKKSP